ncbi:hypothetical protein KC365_g10982 [Hortaea werneckii]|nr:hypothetical protein KC339_g12519 [Hortaea werneckii]KAI7224092.1 hypothetical protein KC365_g10982 [Hortaea werneckii]KAI7379146.1 hypothetical protein KC328_g13486 [Hortaea werneckii]
MKAVHGHPELAALIKGSYRGMRMQTASPSMVREYRRQASRTSVNPAAATVPVCPNSNGQLYEDDFGALYIINCGAYNTGTNYTILWSRDSGCTTLRCCMDYCDGFQDCFGTALLLGTQNNNCTFFYPPNGTHYANNAYNIAYLYRAANQPNLELANKYTDSYLYNRIICHGYADLLSHPDNHQRRNIDIDGGQQLLYNRGQYCDYKLCSNHNSKPTWDHRDFDTTGIDQYGHVYPTCKHKYGHIYSACKYKHCNYGSTNDAAARNDDPADYVSLYFSYNGNIDRTNHGDFDAPSLSASVDKYSYPDRSFNAFDHPKCDANLDIELAWHDSHHYIYSA